MAPADDKLASLRAEIDAVDDALLALLNRRAHLVEAVGACKQSSGGGFYVPSRERAIIDRLQEANAGPFPTSGIRPVFQEVISACLSLEKGVRVAYLGPEATFTHQAVKRHFGTSAPTVPCGSIAMVFEEVERGQAEFGVVPVENSTEGVVSHTLDTFLETPLVIRAELVIAVEQCLLARADVREGQLERIYSHPQGIAQCRAWLHANLPAARIIECASTAAAARRASDDGAGGAIAGEMAARMYGLSVLRRAVQDSASNATRFLVIGAAVDEPRAAAGDYKTSLLLVLGNRPGDLYQALRPISEAGVNLSKIESRPSKRQAWEYVFFLDLEGHRDDPPIAAVLAAIPPDCQVKVLGSYRKADLS